MTTIIDRTDEKDNHAQLCPPNEGYMLQYHHSERVPLTSRSAEFIPQDRSPSKEAWKSQARW